MCEVMCLLSVCEDFVWCVCVLILFLVSLCVCICVFVCVDFVFDVCADFVFGVWMLWCVWARRGGRSREVGGWVVRRVVGERGDFVCVDFVFAVCVCVDFVCWRVRNAASFSGCKAVHFHSLCSY